MFVIQEPPRQGTELRWSMLGVRFRVMPSFFFYSALFAYLMIGQFFGNDLTTQAIGVAIDVGCIFAAVLFTELVQGLVYRSYGLRATVVIQEFGGGVYPEAEPPMRIQRIVVALSNPASCFLLLALVYYSNQEYGWSGTSNYAAFAYFILWIVSLVWGVIGLLPIFPYSGGRVMLELFSAVLPRQGMAVTLVASIAVGLAYIAYTVLWYLNHVKTIHLTDDVPLPASIILSVFFAITTIRNWQLLQMARRQPRVYHPDDEYDDRDPWDRR